MTPLRIRLFRERLLAEVRDNLLPFWSRHVADPVRGGFIGALLTPHTPEPQSPRSLVLNARILWTFSAASRVLGDPSLLMQAEAAHAYLQAHFHDTEHGGYFWMVDADGHPVDRSKVVYGNAFVLYALSEYYRARPTPEVRDQAIAQFRVLDAHAHDDVYGGYLEGFTEDWTSLGGMSLAMGETRAEKSMNTHLHVLEAFTNLLRIWDDEAIRSRHREVLAAMADHVVMPLEDRFGLFFEKNWQLHGDITSFGHDIEGSWLMFEAAEVLDDAALLSRIRALAIRMARRALATGMDSAHGGMYDEIHEGVLRDGKVWWVQAEAVVGFTNAWQLTGETAFLDAAFDTWMFTDAYLVDHAYGEWFGATDAAGRRGYAFSNEKDMKVGPWKCPYHNARMCLEMLERLAP